MLNAYYPSHEAYLDAIAREMAHEYRAVVGAGFVLQIDAPDLAMERVLVYQDKSDAEFVEITPVATPAHGIVKDAHRVPAPAKRRIEKATESDAGSRLGH